jgi:hypothetical protein
MGLHESIGAIHEVHIDRHAPNRCEPGVIPLKSRIREDNSFRTRRVREAHRPHEVNVLSEPAWHHPQLATADRYLVPPLLWSERAP